MPAPKDPKRYEEWCKEVSERTKGRRHTQEARDKISAANRASNKYGPRSEETKAKMSASTKGRKVSDEHKAKLSAAHKGRKMSDEQKKKLSIARTGYKMSDEQKQKLSEAGKRRKLSESHKAALAASRVGKKMSEEHKARLTSINKGKEMPAELRARLSESIKTYYASLSDEEREARHEKWLETVKDKDTSIERFVASLLDRYGIKYIPQKRIGYYSVDFFLPDTNTVVEVNGCWWHACDPCGYNTTEYSVNKRLKDEKRIAFIVKKGYTVIILWEHELRPFMKEDKFTKE